jgi:MFS family permease
MSRIRLAANSTFRALRRRNYRLFFFGQIVSLSGTWMQGVGQAWLVLKLTGSGTAIGLVIALQTLPMLLGGAWGGVVADRYDKRMVLLGTQLASAVLAVVLGLLTITGSVQLWMVMVLAFALGCINMIDLPTRQTFVLEMVGKEDLTNAISLNSVIMNGSRVIGPAAAGLVIFAFGIAPVFLINAASYLAVLVALLAIRVDELHLGQRVPRAPGQLVAGLRYAWATPEVRTPLLLMAVVGTFAYEFQVTLPLIARFTFHSGAEAFGLMSSAMGTGAVIGGLVTASRGHPTGRALATATAVFGVLILVAAAAPSLPIELALLAATGAASIVFAALANSTLQLASAPEMRGRVMALYAVAFLGSTPIGGPLVGWVGQTFDPRAALALGGIAALLAAALAWRPLTRVPATEPATQPVALPSISNSAG